MSLRDVAESLLENWSNKDAAGVASLLREDAVITGPLAPGGRMEGPEVVNRFLGAQNADRSKFPDKELKHHEMMASSKAQVKRVVEQGNTVAVEAELTTGNDGKTRKAALFIDVDPEQKIKNVNIYFFALPN